MNSSTPFFTHTAAPRVMAYAYRTGKMSVLEIAAEVRLEPHRVRRILALEGLMKAPPPKYTPISSRDGERAPGPTNNPGKYSRWQPIPQEEVVAIIALYKGGASLQDIGNLRQMSHTTIRSLLLRHQVPMRPRKRNPTDVDTSSF